MVTSGWKKRERFGNFVLLIDEDVSLAWKVKLHNWFIMSYKITDTRADREKKAAKNFSQQNISFR